MEKTTTIKNCNNIKALATELSELIGKPVGVDNIHPSTEGRFYYIQNPLKGSPMLLHHYRGPFFVDIHPDDYEKLASNAISAHEYLSQANWLVGYFWGGGSMVSGGYYQPLDIIGNSEEVRRYCQILTCRGWYRSNLTKKHCDSCWVESCPYKSGEWNKEPIKEWDPRVSLFNSLKERFEKENPGYTLQGFLCDEVPEGEIWLRPNYHNDREEKFSFTAYVSSSVIRALLMRETEPEEFVGGDFKILKLLDQAPSAVNPESLRKAFKGLDLAVPAEVQTESNDVNEEKVSLLDRVGNFFKRK